MYGFTSKIQSTRVISSWQRKREGGREGDCTFWIQVCTVMRFIRIEKQAVTRHSSRSSTLFLCEYMEQVVAIERNSKRPRKEVLALITLQYNRFMSIGIIHSSPLAKPFTLRFIANQRPWMS